MIPQGRGSMSDMMRRSALEDTTPIVHGDAIAITVAPPLARAIVRGGAAAAAAVGAAFGTPLPASPCRAATLGARAALWLGPDEWLLLAPEDDAVMAALSASLADVAGAVVDIGHRQVAMRIDGAHAATLLNGGCPLDLDADAFPVGMCTRTVFGKTEIMLWRRAADGFHVEVARSFATYVHALLREIAIDFAG
jgi:sarcosine oxidase subunit gamma